MITILPCDSGGGVGDPSPISNDEVIFFPDKQEKPKREKRETVKTVKKEFRLRHQKESELKDLKATFNAKSDCLDTKWEKFNFDDGNRKNDNKAPLKTISHRKLNRRKKRSSQGCSDRENSKLSDRNKEKGNSSSSEASNDVNIAKDSRYKRIKTSLTIHIHYNSRFLRRLLVRKG